MGVNHVKKGIFCLARKKVITLKREKRRVHFHNHLTSLETINYRSAIKLINKNYASCALMCIACIDKID